jgi:hypothetical protein
MTTFLALALILPPPSYCNQRSRGCDQFRIRYHSTYYASSFFIDLAPKPLISSRKDWQDKALIRYHARGLHDLCKLLEMAR